MNLIILLKLLFTHVICDFGLQPKKMAEAKFCHQKKKKALALILHSLIHAIVTYLVVALWTCWLIPVIIFTSHLLIDWGKSMIKNSSLCFIIDQCLHLFVIIVLWLFLSEQFLLFADYITMALSNTNIWMIITAYLFVLKPSSVLISLSIKRWTPDIKTETKGEGIAIEANDSLQKAGQWIGYLERTLILTFMLVNQIAAVGFLFAAKSIFRVGDLRPGRNLKMTEYVLIGTFSSFFIAIIAGIIIHALI